MCVQYVVLNVKMSGAIVCLKVRYVHALVRRGNSYVLERLIKITFLLADCYFSLRYYSVVSFVLMSIVSALTITMPARIKLRQILLFYIRL